MRNEIKDWKKDLAYFKRKYGKDSIEAKAAKLNLERVKNKKEGRIEL